MRNAIYFQEVVFLVILDSLITFGNPKDERVRRYPTLVNRGPFKR